MSVFEVAARAHAASRAAKGTRKIYNAALDRWLAWCEHNGHLDPTRPSLFSAAAFRDELQSELAGQTVRRILASLSSLYSAAMDSEVPLATWNPFRKLPRPPADAYARTEAFSQEESRAILTAVDQDTSEYGVRDAAILWLLYETGLRRASIAGLTRPDDLFTRDGKFMVRVVLKGGKRGEAEVPEMAATALKKWLDTAPPSRFVFPARRNKGSLDPTAVNKIVLRYAKVAKVSHAHPHRFRATYATDAIDALVPIHDLQASMHHSSTRITQRYDRGTRGKGVSSAVAKFRKQRHIP